MSQQSYYHHFVKIWKELNELHLQLFDLTSREYLHLLASEFEELESLLIQKELIVNQIHQVDLQRSQLILKLGLESECDPDALNSFTSTKNVLYAFCQINDSAPENDILDKYNKILIEIIGKIQTQNKKNRLYLNRALHQLSDIQSEFIGKQKIETYNNLGEKRNLTR